MQLTFPRNTLSVKPDKELTTVGNIWVYIYYYWHVTFHRIVSCAHEIVMILGFGYKYFLLPDK
jgi:hypothetical protein